MNKRIECLGLQDDLVNKNELELFAIASLSMQQFEVYLHALGLVTPEKDGADYDFSEVDDYIRARGDQKRFKKTLGKLKDDYGEKLGIKNIELDKLVAYRNNLCHNYFRKVYLESDGFEELNNPIEFLREAILLSRRYNSALAGLIAEIITKVEKDNSALSSDHAESIEEYNKIAQQSKIEDKISKLAEEYMSLPESPHGANLLKFLQEGKFIRLINLIEAHPNPDFKKIIKKIISDAGVEKELSLLKHIIKKDVEKKRSK